jgi:hypothetical protein
MTQVALHGPTALHDFGRPADLNVLGRPKYSRTA